MASLVYNNAKELLLNGGVNFSSDTIKLAILTSSYTPNVDSDTFWSDISTNEVGASGTYSTGGVTLTVTVSQDNTDDEGVMDAVDVSFTSATITGRYAAIYKSTGVAGTSPLLCLIDFGSNQSSSSGTFTITFSSEGILNLN